MHSLSFYRVVYRCRCQVTDGSVSADAAVRIFVEFMKPEFALAGTLSGFKTQLMRRMLLAFITGFTRVFGRVKDGN